jgi:hypothetical protein
VTEVHATIRAAMKTQSGKTTSVINRVIDVRTPKSIHDYSLMPRDESTLSKLCNQNYDSDLVSPLSSSVRCVNHV